MYNFKSFGYGNSSFKGFSVFKAWSPSLKVHTVDEAVPFQPLLNGYLTMASTISSMTDGTLKWTHSEYIFSV